LEASLNVIIPGDLAINLIDRIKPVGEPTSMVSKVEHIEHASEFSVGTEVAYLIPAIKKDGGLWIQCTICSITECNAKRRYEVQVVDRGNTEELGYFYTASAEELVTIPDVEAELRDLAVGAVGIARYPDTSFFYKAEVLASSGTKVECRVFKDGRFQKVNVDRRFVLDSISGYK
jgi:hypothetical protein